MWNNLKIGTRLVLAFGSMALLVALLMGMALAGIGGAAQALHDPAMVGHPAQAHLDSARAWVIGCGGLVFVLALCPFSDCARAS